MSYYLKNIINYICGLFISMSIFTVDVFATVELEISDGTVQKIPLALDTFSGSDTESFALGENIVQVISSDLENSGLFRMIDKNSFLERGSFTTVPGFDNWRKLNASVLVVGRVINASGNTIIVEYKIWNPYNEKLVHAHQFKVTKSSWYRVGHKIADAIYEVLTGDPGYFDSRIVFVSEEGSRRNRIKRLAIMDQDGRNYKVLTSGKEMVLSPRFDPKSQRIIYMSYKTKIPKVFLFDLQSGIQKLIGDFPGISFSPRFSPDGNYALMSVARNGSTNIYELNLSTKEKTQLTFDFGVINTSPCYSPDGSKIAFSSDRSGKNALYIMNRDGSGQTKISKGRGSYTEPVWSPRGDLIAFTKMASKRFYIGLIRPNGDDERLITVSWLDESPTWAPNGRVLMFSRQQLGGRPHLVSVDVTGHHERVVETPTDASGPAWSPILR